jgi:hypothetical protein
MSVEPIGQGMNLRNILLMNRTLTSPQPSPLPRRERRGRPKLPFLKNLAVQLQSPLYHYLAELENLENKRVRNFDETVHNPPKRRWRRLYSSNAAKNCGLRKSGHKVGVTTNSA